MEFKNAVDEVDKLYRSCSFSYFHNVLLLTKPAPNMLETAYNYFKQAIAGKKAVEVINQGYKELITESKSTKSIRKTFDYSPVESVASAEQKINWGTVVHRRILNFVFLNLFKEQYEEHGVAPIDLHMAAMFFYEIILSHKLNIMILNEILPKYNFKNTEKVKNYILLELILTETLKTFQPSGHLVYLACIASQLEDEIRTQEAGKLSIQVALEKLAVHINDISTCGLENLASWFAHVKANKPALTLAWLKDQKGTEKGKFLIGMVLRDIMQLSSYSKLNEFNGLAEFIEQFPENPQPVCELVNAGHIRHADYQILLDKLTQEISGEEMSQVLNSNDLSCCGSELQDVFLQTLLQKSRYARLTQHLAQRALRDARPLRRGPARLLQEGRAAPARVSEDHRAHLGELTLPHRGHLREGRAPRADPHQDHGRLPHREAHEPGDQPLPQLGRPRSPGLLQGAEELPQGRLDK